MTNFNETCETIYETHGKTHLWPDVKQDMQCVQ